MASYDPNNIFAKILRGELPSYMVYEDDKAVAFLDIMPRAPGHTLVLPKTPARNILDIDPDELAHVMRVAQKIAKASLGV
ncbi:MAG: HIT domain-containing protein, partial [Xanthobacteraceae bacterium]